MALSPDNTHIFSGTSDETIRIWNGKTGAPIGKPLKGHTGIAFSVAFSPSGAHIVSCSGDETIRIWDAHKRTPLDEPLEGHDWKVYKVMFSSDGTRIVSASSMVLSPDEARVVSGSQDCSIHIWDVRSRALIGAQLKGHTEKVYLVVFLPDNTPAISCSGDGTICIWAALWNSSSSDIVSSEMVGTAFSILPITFY